MQTENTMKTKRQEDADVLRERAREIEKRAAFVSDEQGGADLEQQARQLRKEATEIEKCLPSE